MADTYHYKHLLKSDELLCHTPAKMPGLASLSACRCPGQSESESRWHRDRDSDHGEYTPIHYMVTFVITKLPGDFVTMACASQKTRLSRLKNDFSSPSRNCTHMYHRISEARRRRSRLNAVQ